MSNTVTLLNSSGNQIGTYSTITEALNNATAGDTVFVGNGTYSENVALVNGVNIQGQSQAGVIINGTISTPTDFDNTTVSNLTVDDNSSTAMLLDMTATQEVTSSEFSNVTFNLESNSSEAVLIGNGQVAYDMALNGTGLTFSGVTMNSNDFNFANSTAFAYTLFHSVGGAQLTLDDVSLNGTASGTDSGLGAQWNMSPQGSEPAAVSIEHSSTSGGGNFYVSGMTSATIIDNTFNGQGLALNGVANASVTGNTFENIDGTYNANGTPGVVNPQHRGLTIENAWGATGDSNITVENNTFSNISVADGAIAFQRWTDGSGDLIPATIGTLNNVDIQNNSFTNVTNAIYLNPSSFGASAVLPASISDSQLILGTSVNDSLTAPTSGTTETFGGGGVDTVTDAGATAADFSVVSGQWTVTNGSAVDTLNGIDQVTDGSGHTFLLVGDGGYATIQDAVDAASAGDTIMIAPGTYAGATIDEALTIIGSGSGSTIVNTNFASDGFDLTGDINATAGGSATVSISGIGFVDNQTGIEVHSTTQLANLDIDGSAFTDNAFNGVGMGSGAPNLANISITNSTFTQNGNGQFNGDGDISLFGFLGNATLENLIVNGGTNTVPTTSNADYGIQIAGFDPTTDNVTAPIGNIVFNNVQVNGSYDKVSVYVQGYTDLNGLDFQNTGNGGTVIDGHDGWGYGLYLDPTAGMTPSATIPVNGTDLFLTTGAQPDSVDLSNVSVTNDINSFTGSPLDTVFNGTPENDTVSGLSSGENYINGAGGVNTVGFTATLTAADFQLENGNWVVTTASDSTVLPDVDVVTDGGGHTFLLVGGTSAYSTDDQAFTSAQFQSGDIIIGTATNSSIAITSGLSNNTPTTGTPLQATVSFTGGDSATSITYTWFANGSQVQSGTSSIYTPTEANVGAVITVDASFTDLFGDAILDTSAATADVVDAAPAVATPTISGLAEVGQTLTATAAATPADDTLTFEWFSSANNFATPIATGSTFAVTATGVSLEVEAIATNANGLTATATSAEIATVPAPTPAINFPDVANSNVDEWILSDGQWAASAAPGSIPSGYQVAGTGDFTGNGTSDILWQNPTSGDTQEWLISNGAYAGTVDLGKHSANATDGASYQIAGIGDFTGNGIDDVLWTSTNSNGTVATDIWELNSNGQWMASVSPGSHPAGYNVVGVGDFTGNGTSDILWMNSSTGDVDEWQIVNGQWSASVDLGSHPGTGWTIAGVGDFFGNGTDDILWTNSSGGQVQTDIWEMNSNGKWEASVSPGSHPAGYTVVGIGDFNDSGTSGILWQNASTGDVDEWNLSNGKWSGSVDLGSHPGGFQLAGAGSFVNSNATSDILWHTTA